VIPFLEIVTRTFGQRPNMLLNNRNSVLALRGADANQVLLVDQEWAGVAAANAALASYTPSSPYVWLLDDDDLCIHPGLVEDLKYLAWLHVSPPAIIVRMDHGAGLGVLPDNAHWRKQPHEGGIGCSAIITRRDVWMHCREAWASGRYASDFDFISAVWAAHHERIIWHDVIASRVQRISMGQPEPEAMTA
jgi:hypothetical protein